MLGRSGELAAVDALFAGARGGVTVLALEGEPGIGKTTVWREAVRRANSAGFRVLSAQPTQTETAMSHAGLGDLLGGAVDEVLEGLPEPQKVAVAAALLLTATPVRGIDARALCAGVLTALRMLATTRPLLLAVDDAQWLDTPSALALGYAVRRLHAEPVGVLVTTRLGAARAATFDVAADGQRRRVVRLGPLSVATLHEAIKQRTGRSLPRPLVVQLTEAAAGNPMYAIEIAAELGDRLPLTGGLPVPPSLTELVASRVRRLPASTRGALLTAAILSRPTTAEVDATALQRAERAGIVVLEGSRVRFVHPMFASAIAALAGQAQQRAAHRRLAANMADAEERARHAALGAEAPDVEVAGRLDAAAQTARARGAPVAAAELLELAISLTPAVRERDRLARLIGAAEAWFDAGDLARAEGMLEEATAGPVDAPLRAHSLHLLGQLHARRSSFAEALAVAQEALKAASGHDALVADVEMDLGYYSACLGDMPGSMGHTEAAVTAAERSGASALLADALGASTMCRFIAGLGLDEDRIRRAREGEDPSRPRAWQMRPAFVHGSMLLYAGRVDEALEVLDALHDDALQRGQESPIPYSCFWLTWANIWRGDFAMARRRTDEARQTAALLDDPGARAMALAAGALLHAHDGSSGLARQEAQESIAIFQRLGWTVGALNAFWGLGLAELSGGNPLGTDAALGAVSLQLTSVPAGDPFLGVLLAVQIEALVELGQPERAEPLLRWLEERASSVDRAWARAAAARCRGLVRAAQGDSEGALRALTEALLQHDRCAIPFERAWTLLVLGKLHRRRKEKRLAAAALRDALHIFEGLGALEWAARTRTELDRLGQRPRAADDLTQTERRVAELAASGLANRQIGERAFLTTKSVEANLTRVYRKLGIRSRGGLARALHEHETSPSSPRDRPEV